MDRSLTIGLSQVLDYLAEQSPEAVALVQVQKAWCSPVQQLGAYSGDPEGFRLRILTRAWMEGGQGVTVKLWFDMPSHTSSVDWLAALEPDSCWTVSGRVVDVGHPKYQTIAVSEMAPMSAAAMRVFLPLIAQYPAAIKL